jgi:hypothetical protein
MSCCHPAHKPPAFPLAVNIWRGVHSYLAAPDVVTVGQLHVPTSNVVYPGSGGIQEVITIRLLYLPKGTDIRYAFGVAPLLAVADTVEVPAGSQRYYRTSDVEDVGKGFPNEFRVAVIFPVEPAFGVGWQSFPYP